MPKLFCVSDVHGFYDELTIALSAAGFDKNNPDHWLIGCGDYFDRGRQPKQMLDFLMNLPRKVLVRGNHEDLFVDMIARGYPRDHDYHNGTYLTALDIVSTGVDRFNTKTIFNDAYQSIRPLLNETVDYFETKNYVFVHGYVPCIIENHKVNGTYHTYIATVENWRDADPELWKQSRWINSIDAVKRNGALVDKTVVAGHWHCSYGHYLDSLETEEPISDRGDDADFSSYYTDGLIAIDACTALSGVVNVLVLEDEFIS